MASTNTTTDVTTSGLTVLTPNPLYGWNPDQHTLTVRLVRSDATYRVYEAFDNGARLGLLVSRRVSATRTTREWDYTTGSDPLGECRVYGHRSRHDAALALLEATTR